MTIGRRVDARNIPKIDISSKSNELIDISKMNEGWRMMNDRILCRNIGNILNIFSDGSDK